MYKKETDINLTELASFIARLNQQSIYHVGYCGSDKDEIRDTLANDFSDYDLEQSFSVLFENGVMIACLGLDIDADNKVAEIWGPFIAENRSDGVALAQKLWNMAISKIESGFTFYGFYNQENIQAKNFMNTIKADQKGSDMILTANKESNIHLADESVYEWGEGWRADFIHLHDSSFPRTYYDGQTILKRLSASNKLFIAEEQGKLVGYIYVEANPEFRDGSIEYVAVSPTNRKKGIGLKLLNYALNYLFEQQKIKDVTICVNTENTSAIKLYKKAGFKEKHILNTYSFHV